MKIQFTCLCLLISLWSFGQQQVSNKNRAKAFKDIRRAYGQHQRFHPADTIRLALSKQTAYYYDTEKSHFVPCVPSGTEPQGLVNFHLYEKCVMLYAHRTGEYHQFQIKSQRKGTNSEGEKFISLVLRENANQAELLIYDTWVELVYLHRDKVFLIEYM